MGVPRIIGNVRPFAELSRGPTTSVYKGVLVDTNELVIVKVLRNEFADDAELAKSFEREASMLARIDHPSVVRILDYGVGDDGVFITTEYVEGASLRQLLQENVLPPATGAFVILQALRGLHAIHNAGLLHRDIKPENIIVGEEGGVKLVDLGLAIVEPSSEDDLMIGGTLGYISPDLLKGQSPSVLSDLYAMGCTLFEALFGHRAFRGATDSELMERMMIENPFDDVQASKYISEELIDVCRSLLSRDHEKPATDCVAHIKALELALSRFTPRPNAALVADAFSGTALLPVVVTVDSSDRAVKTAQLRHQETAGSPSSRWPRIAALSLLPILAAVLFVSIQNARDNAVPSTTDASLRADIDTVGQADLLNASRDSSALILSANDSTLQPTDADQQVASIDVGIDPLESPLVADTVSEGDPDSLVTGGNTADNSSETVEDIPEMAFVVISASPWASVMLDGEVLGVTPLEDTLAIEPGKHELVFINPMFPEHTRQVDIQPGYSIISVSMWETVGLVHISVSPWAIVSIDGNVADTIPPQESPFILTPGPHRLLFEHPEMGEWETELVVVADSSYTLEVNMFDVAD